MGRDFRPNKGDNYNFLKWKIKNQKEKELNKEIKDKVNKQSMVDNFELLNLELEHIREDRIRIFWEELNIWC